MRVLVTGATGFTGSHSARTLLEAGHEVRTLVRSRQKLEKTFGPESPLCKNAVVGDVTNQSDVDEALEGCDAVLHAAAMVDLRQSMAERVLQTNRLGVENVIGGAAARGFRSIVYVSSLAAFFDPEARNAAPLSPEGAMAPTSSAYGQSKIDSEKYIRRLQEEGVPIRASYPVGILGPDDPGLSEANHAIKAWLGQQPVTTSSGLQILDVRDLATLHLHLLEGPSEACRYVAAGAFIPWKEMGPLLSSLTQRPVRPLHIPGPAFRLIGRIGDAIKKVWDFDYPITYEAMCFATLWPGADASGTERDLGMKFRPKEETLRDTIHWLWKAGHLPAKIAGRLADDRP